MAHPGGRPLEFKTPEEFTNRAEVYFQSTPFEEWTITGLALHLKTYRSTLMDYEARDEFYNAIKTAKQRIEHSYECSLRKNGKAGDIFGLKNFGWKDQKQIELNDVTQLSEEQIDSKLSKLLGKA